MKLTYWEKGTMKRLYVQGISQDNGKVFLEATPSGKPSVKRNGLKFTTAEKKEILADIFSSYSKGSEVSFSELVALASADGSGNKRGRSKSKHFGAPAERDRKNESLGLEMHTIPIEKPMDVILDHREPDELRRLLASHPQINVSVETLEMGDIIINNKYVIERKRCTDEVQASDFETSIKEKDKRLFTQSERMKLQEDFVPIFLLEGDCYKNSRTMLIQAIDGAISFLVAIQSMSVLNSYSLQHTAYIIAKLGAHDLNGLETPVLMRAKKPEILSDRKHFVLEGVVGINKALAEELLSVFGSIKGVALATKEELLDVHGMGDVKVKDLMEAFH